MNYVNLFDSASLTDVAPYIITGGAMDGSKIGERQEFDYASYDDIKHAATWEYPHFGYSINKYGFRTTDDIPNEIDIAAYGCSFTYGLGLPEHMLYHTVLGKELNKPVMNFGINGASVETITNVFLITSKHINIKHAVFLLPSLDRSQIAVNDPKTNRLLYISLIPNFIPTTAKEFGLHGDMIYKYVPDEERLKTFVNCIYLLDYISQKQDAMNAMQKVAQVDQGQQLNDTPDTSNASGKGYTEMGNVYKDPSSGKLIMVQSTLHTLYS